MSRASVRVDGPFGPDGTPLFPEGGEPPNAEPLAITLPPHIRLPPPPQMHAPPPPPQRDDTDTTQEGTGPRRFESHVAIVTGGSSGIGLACMPLPTSAHIAILKLYSNVASSFSRRLRRHAAAVKRGCKSLLYRPASRCRQGHPRASSRRLPFEGHTRDDRQHGR